MDALIGKLTNLAYEFFGILLPGAIAALLLSLLWIAAGPLIPVWSFGDVPQLSLADLATWDARGMSGTFRVCLVLTTSYFLGHSLNWVSRRPRDAGVANTSFLQRLGRVLMLRMPKPDRSYHQEMEALFEIARRRLAPVETPLSWRQFYPVAKVLINQKLTYSLLASYQYKYTLHRALATACALLFWSTAGVMVAAGLSHWPGHRSEQPTWLLLSFLLALAPIAASGFANSYMYAWKLFGDTVITESYLLTSVLPSSPAGALEKGGTEPIRPT